MKIIYLTILILHTISGKISKLEKLDYCKTLNCDDSVVQKVCGMRKENGSIFYKIFDNMCLLMKYGCQVDNNKTYGIINMKNCKEHIFKNIDKSCPDCVQVKDDPVCGIRKDGDGFRIRIFSNKCKLIRFNCENQLNFYATDFFICVKHNSNSSIEKSDDDETYAANADVSEEIDETENGTRTETIIIEETKNDNMTVIEINETSTALASYDKKNKTIYKNIVVVGGFMSDFQNINYSVENFFAATHVLDLPVQEMQSRMTEDTRRRLIKVFGPIKVFTPWLKIPKNVSEDYYHKPTLSSCFHKCPTQCPDTYAPVCGMPGIIAREPSLMFQNHCFMDVAQCKMFWEDKSYTAESSAYIESSFLFCLGDELNGVYRFLPLIRTLQHMGRLKSRGRFKYKLRNMRFFNQLMASEPNIMG